MRKAFFLLAATLITGAVFLGGVFQTRVVSADPMESQCDSVSSWSGTYWFDEGDVLSTRYTATAGGPSAEISFKHLGPASGDATKPVPGPGVYILTLTIPTSGPYTIYNDETGGAAGLFELPICGLYPSSLAPAGDPDEDGISGANDNCPYAYNPDQEDGWGSGAGDECDSDWYNMTGLGVAGFEQKDGTYHLHGNCTFMADGDPRCPEIAVFDPATFTPDAMPMSVATEAAGTWYVEVNYLHSNNGADVYQVNVYSTTPPQPDTLLDDRLELHINADGTWQWYQRGGSSDYNGI